MTLYCISYDLIDGKTEDYKELYKKIKAYGTYSHTLESTWFVETNESVSQVRDNLKSTLDKDDKLIVIEVVKHWASYNLRKSTADWLKARF